MLVFAAVLVLASWTSAATSSSSSVADKDDLTWWQLSRSPEEDTIPPGPGPTAEDLAQNAKKLGKANPTKGTYNLIVKHGYPVENHTVHTADGYILGVFRVPLPGKPVVLVQHGLLTSSADLVVSGRGRALAFVLYDAGFDVWMCNHRGTSPSRRHERLRPEHPRFWDFSFHELGVLDLPACIDYVLKATDQTTLHYVGHSQATTSFFAMASERPQYMEKIKTFIGLGPIAFARDVRSYPLRFMAMFSNRLLFLFRLIGLNEFLPSSKLLVLMSEMLCPFGHSILCLNIIFLMLGVDSTHLDETVMPEILANTPAGASSKQIVHYLQLMKVTAPGFRQFDYGRLGNMHRYKMTRPPEYDLSKVTALTYLFNAGNDILSVQSDIDELSRRLPNIAKDGIKRLPSEDFNHLDFLYAIDAKELVYDDVIDIIEKRDRNN